MRAACSILLLTTVFNNDFDVQQYFFNPGFNQFVIGLPENVNVSKIDKKRMEN